MKRLPLKEEHKKLLASFQLEDSNLSGASVLKFESGEVIIREGLLMEYLLFVVSGKAKVYTTALNGKNLLLYNYISGGLIGDVELMTSSYIASTTMQATTEFTCIALPFRIYGESLKKNPEFVNKVGQELAFKLLRNSKNNAITVLHSGEERLCAYILQTAEGDLFIDKLADVANFIGVSYRHLLRMLKELTDKGILKKQTKGYLILDQASIRKRSSDLFLK